jgi:AcrR family transcriptional regulator
MPSSTKKNSRREQILETASRLFLEKGYKGSSMRLLAEHTGMEAASLYNHISGKEELLKEICFVVAANYLRQLTEVENKAASPREKVELIIRFQIHMMLESFEQVYISQRDWKHLRDPWLSDFLAQRRQYEKRFSDIIAAGIEEGVFADINPYVAVLGILSAIRGIEHWHRHKKGVSATVLEDDLTDMLIKGLT